MRKIMVNKKMKKYSKPVAVGLWAMANWQYTSIMCLLLCTKNLFKPSHYCTCHFISPAAIGFNGNVSLKKKRKNIMGHRIQEKVRLYATS